MIPLDIYKKIYHNKIKNKCSKLFDNKLEAWLALFSIDEPEVVIQLVKQYPEFKSMYEEVYRLCLNTEEVMQMFSKELAELDRNTVQLMIDEMQEEINSQKKELENQAEALKNKDKAIEEEQKRYQRIIQTIYSNVQDVNQAARLIGCSAEEVESALEE